MDMATLLVGTYTYGGQSRGIYAMDYDKDTGLMVPRSVCSETENPSFLCRVSGETVAAVQELMDRGSIATYSLTGINDLEFISKVDMPGGLMCHLRLWPGGRFISATNYLTGSLVVCPVGSDGVVEAPTATVQYSGKGVDPVRQDGPHTHSTIFDPSGKWLLAAELGLDRIIVYSVDTSSGEIAENPAMPYVQAPDGSGPRHFAFHPNGHTLYVSAELSNQVLVYNFDSGDGTLTLTDVLSTLPEKFAGKNLAADIHCSDDGSFVYVSNRGHDSIAVFRTSSDGSIRPLGHCPSYGRSPRSFTIAPHQIIIISNQDSGNIVSCRIDPFTGMIAEKLCEVEVPMAVYTLLIDRK